jgi:hypothetical protein
MAGTKLNIIRKPLFLLFLAFTVLVLVGTLILLSNLDRLVRDACIRAAADRGIRLEVGTVRCSLWNGTLEARNLTFYNPPECTEEILAACPQLSATILVWDSIRHRRLHFAKLQLAVSEASYEVRRNGTTNLDMLVGRSTAAELACNSTRSGEPVPCSAPPADHPAGTPPAAAESATFPVIDRLALRVAVLHVRNAALEKPATFTLTLNSLERIGANIDSEAKLRDFFVREFMPAIRNGISEQQPMPGGTGILESDRIPPQ